MSVPPCHSIPVSGHDDVLDISVLAFNVKAKEGKTEKIGRIKKMNYTS